VIGIACALNAIGQYGIRQIVDTLVMSGKIKQELKDVLQT
jgi:hypothetical protein